MDEEGESKKRNWLLTGGLGAAFLGSLCFIGPAAFIALGLGSFAAGAFALGWEDSQSSLWSSRGDKGFTRNPV